MVKDIVIGEGRFGVDDIYANSTDPLYGSESGISVAVHTETIYIDLDCAIKELDGKTGKLVFIPDEEVE